jgi:hypothetical protein
MFPLFPTGWYFNWETLRFELWDKGRVWAWVHVRVVDEAAGDVWGHIAARLGYHWPVYKVTLARKVDCA